MVQSLEHPASYITQATRLTASYIYHSGWSDSLLVYIGEHCPGTLTPDIHSSGHVSECR